MVLIFCSGGPGTLVTCMVGVGAETQTDNYLIIIFLWIFHIKNSKQMNLNKTSRVAGPGSTVHMNKSNFYQRPSKNEIAVSRLQIDPGVNNFWYS